MDKMLTPKEVIELLEEHNHKELHVHHTWRPNHASFTGNNYKQLQDSMRNYHMNELGWDDIGQHLTIFPDGWCVTGRSFSITPCSIKGHNTGAFSVEMIGDFDNGKDVFKGEQKEAMIKIAKWFYDNNKKIVFHREHSTKTCPGSSIGKNKFMSEVVNYVDMDSVSSWAKESWDKAIEKGIQDGYGAKNQVTEEQLMVFFDKLGLL